MKTHTSIISESVSRAVTRSNQEICEADGDIELEWYQRYLKNCRSMPAIVPSARLMESTPYKLVITRLNGLRINRKVPQRLNESPNNDLYPRFTCMLVSASSQQLLSNSSVFLH
jgi:hypothetical protein